MNWMTTDDDRECFDRYLNDFVPDRVYDVHAHLWRRQDWGDDPPLIVQAAPVEVGLDVYRKAIGWILPDRKVHGLHFAFPAVFPTDTASQNRWVAEQIRRDPLARGQYFVRPDDDPDFTAAEVKRLGLRGFKVFTGFLNRPDKENAEIPEYFPEWIARLADREGWTVTLHQHRSRSLADPSNIHWINHYCRNYPNMRLILDHCARGFNPYHLIEGLRRLERHPNLYVDTSVACNPLAVIACLQFFGAKNVLYASDFFCSHLRGTNFPVGDSFMWLDEDAPIWDGVAYGRRPVLIGLENLRAVRCAFEVLRLSDRDVEDYFWNNAAELLGVQG
ncbi:MAG: amidohydrolase [Phycisphaerae bacterium]|nr:amidohydrolase [Phycisphaerae bacterium]